MFRRTFYLSAQRPDSILQFLPRETRDGTKTFEYSDVECLLTRVSPIQMSTEQEARTTNFVNLPMLSKLQVRSIPCPISSRSSGEVRCSCDRVVFRCCERRGLCRDQRGVFSPLFWASGFVREVLRLSCLPRCLLTLAITNNTNYQWGKKLTDRHPSMHAFSLYETVMCELNFSQSEVSLTLPQTRRRETAPNPQPRQRVTITSGPKTERPFTHSASRWYRL